MIQETAVSDSIIAHFGRSTAKSGGRDIFNIPQWLRGAQGYPLPYAKLLTSEEVREVMHCPWCNDGLLVAVGPTLLVRTAEGVNVTFANFAIARGAAELLNSMVNARSRCAQAEYNLALKQYQDLIGQPEERPAHGGDNAGSVFNLLNPHHDLSPLAEYVVPPFQNCTQGKVSKR